MAVKANTIGGIVRHFGAHTPDAVAILAPGRDPLSFADLARRLDDVQQRLNRRGIGRGDRVAIVLPNGADMAVCFLGVADCATAVPVNPAYTADEYDVCLSDLSAKALIVLTDNDTPAKATAERLGMLILELEPAQASPAGTFALRGPSGGEAARPGRAKAGDTALVLHTSGTTSRPKMVPLSHANMCTSAENMHRWLHLDREDRCLQLMALFHIHGLVAGLLAPLLSGGSTICPLRFELDNFFAWMKEWRPTWYSAVPMIHDAVLAAALQRSDDIADHTLRFIRNSSASLSVSVMAELERTFGVPVVEAFSMTEASHQVCCNPLPPECRKPGSVGKPAGVEVAIMDGAGRVLAAGATGEIVVRGPTVMAAYENDPEANAAAFIDGWFRTGDLGKFDEDGYLTLTGRIKETINLGGWKVSPAEVDTVLLNHPDVVEAATFAIAHKTLGEEVAAAVVLRRGASVSDKDIRTYARKSLAHFKVPHKIVYLDALPKGPTGKVKRNGLAAALGLSEVIHVEQQIEHKRADEGSRQLAPLETTLAGLWENVLYLDMVGPEDDFLRLGGDSLQAIRLTNLVSEVFGIELPIEFIFSENRTVRAMARAIVKARHKKNA